MRAAVVVLAVCPACLSAPTMGEVAPDAGADAAPSVCPPIGGASDDFDELRYERWAFIAPSFGCVPHASDGRLIIDDDGVDLCGMASIGCFDMTDRALEVEALAPGAEGQPGLVFGLRATDFGDEMRFVVTPGADGVELSIVWVSPEGGERVLTSLPFDPELHQVWRFTHSVTENRLTFETTPRDLTEYTRYAELFLDGVTLTRVQVVLTSGGAGGAGSVAFGPLHGIEF
jgi:hypothetical protein